MRGYKVEAAQTSSMTKVLLHSVPMNDGKGVEKNSMLQAVAFSLQHMAIIDNS